MASSKTGSPSVGERKQAGPLLQPNDSRAAGAWTKTGMRTEVVTCKA